MSTYAIGDIQGCFREFHALLDLIDFRPSSDRLWLVGDLINRGPGNAETMDLVLSLPDPVIILGNHDLHFLAVATNCHRSVPQDTFGDLLARNDLDDLIEWFRHRPLIHHDSRLGYTMVHAGLPPIWDLDTCLERAREVENSLQGEHFRSFLENMYGNTPDRWHDTLAGNDRLRVITNYFTRMRFCTADGRLELQHKTTIQPQGYAPWFRHPAPAHEGLRILFGHWAALEGKTDNPDVIALDTGCVWGRALTAIRLEDGRFFSVPACTPHTQVP